MNLHFIAIGGSVMHSLAIALKTAGHQVTGSDDQIYDPARSRLAEHGLLPDEEGWSPVRIHAGLDAVILGMHAAEENPELVRARKIGLPVYSFPEFIYRKCRNKQRVVIAGSYGKTTVTAMVMHVLKEADKKFDYLVGAQVAGFDNSVRMSEDAPLLIAEGDEYLASRLDPRPKFLLYQPHISLITGVSWDHVNVFPTEMDYIDAFDALIGVAPKAGIVIFHEKDQVTQDLAEAYKDRDHSFETFSTPNYRVEAGKFVVEIGQDSYPVSVIGRHNMTNLAAAAAICRQLGIERDSFYRLVSEFPGADRRLQKKQSSSGHWIYRDFAHAPAKVRATVEAVRELYPKQKLVAVAELHTYSSLDPDYIPLYEGSLAAADERIVFIDRETWRRKRREPIPEDKLREAFGDAIQIVDNAAQLEQTVRESHTDEAVLLLMSSANFGGANLEL